jgi:alanine-synthesizing transaminase
MTHRRLVTPSEGLSTVRYEIRGRLARRALEMERLGYEIISLNIGNPGAFGFRTPETMRLAMIENLRAAEGYCHQKGIFPAREAVAMQQQERGVRGVTAEEVFIGNGVSELIDLTLRALLNGGDEVLVPSPDYPLWTAAVNLNRGRAVHYNCRPENAFVPDAVEIERLVTRRTRAIVVINPNNPTAPCIRAQRWKQSCGWPSSITWSSSATRSTTRCSTMAPSSYRSPRWCNTHSARR